MTATLTIRDRMQALRNIYVFSDTCEQSLRILASCSEKVSLRQGQTLLRADVVESHAFLLLEGSLRLLGRDPILDDLFTVSWLGPGELVGVIDLLRQGACEAAIARQPCQLLSFPLNLLFELMKEDLGLRDGLRQLQSPCEGAAVLGALLQRLNPPPKDAQAWILSQLKSSTDPEQGHEVFLLSSVVTGAEDLVGHSLSSEQREYISSRSSLPLRFWRWKETTQTATQQETLAVRAVPKIPETKNKNWKPGKTLDFAAIGLREAHSESDLQSFRPIRGQGLVAANLAALRMVSQAYDAPCPVDVLTRLLEGIVKRTGLVSIQDMGHLTELMGLQTQLGGVLLEQLHRLKLPVLVSRGRHFALLTKANHSHVMLADPEMGWLQLPSDEAHAMWGDQVQVILLNRLASTPKRRFGWVWFAPVLERFRWQLVQVLLASLLIQLFQLVNPLLIQQIIDKVINQGNLSALQVLGIVLIASTLFQGLLAAVRTWLLIDTTDRMDLLLGSQVIDNLLRLPLRFFEHRPVGELSQRLSELGNLRGFLTGTAITSTLDLLFAAVYILIMLLYSPLLTALALGTVPFYIGLILFAAPLYRRIIRRQMQFAARTQSHLIETLSGIQTVKAQHFELNSRWRWQEFYSRQITEGFKGTVLGSSTSEAGNSLNQLGSILIIWVGVHQVVNSKLSLGQLIAFRIIAGYVTGPILRLSSLWQGFQQANISMERLAEVVNQVPEADQRDADQIILPPIQGQVSFERLIFRFGRRGPYQIDGVDLQVPAGSFVGIVGPSGSGKSTLMKLLPRLYEPEQGRILIDGFDITKVNLKSIRQQIGIVPQDCLLFAGTIRENIAINCAEVSTEAIIRVARAAAAHDFIMELPNGYSTHIGERGTGLSGGQRQCIAIARTLLQNPNLLILDEATSALDYATEAVVCRNLQNVLRGKTVFFVTHRLRTVRHADQIVLMHRGKISEIGTHAELISRSGYYAALYFNQDSMFSEET
ncbi:peptidase C39 [cyanobiont of Ornithocercus magnificus]|nr:peptidase C39 [cyanobiont of Ornithocercus magnificus]